MTIPKTLTVFGCFSLEALRQGDLDLILPAHLFEGSAGLPFSILLNCPGMASFANHHVAFSRHLMGSMALPARRDHPCPVPALRLG